MRVAVNMSCQESFPLSDLEIPSRRQLSFSLFCVLGRTLFDERLPAQHSFIVLSKNGPCVHFIS